VPRKLFTYATGLNGLHTAKWVSLQYIVLWLLFTILWFGPCMFSLHHHKTESWNRHSAKMRVCRQSYIHITWQAAACAGQSGPCRLLLQPLNISWTTVTEPALAASPAADQLQTRQTLLSGYFFLTARLPRWFDQPIQSVSLVAIIHTEASVSSAAQLGHCCSSFLCCCSETLELSSTELSNCSIR